MLDSHQYRVYTKVIIKLFVMRIVTIVTFHNASQKPSTSNKERGGWDMILMNK